MNTRDNNLYTAESYYNAMMRQDFESVEKYLHSDVYLISPLATKSGKDAVVEAAKKFATFCSDIEIRAKFSSDKQIMFAYDLTLSEPIGLLRAAVLMEFKNKLISRIELFYDGRQFEQIKHGIFQ